ncbi:MAG: hypothetical protein KKF50_02405 [Nanoarchaeota archaeon]|nr:hypothetical protein [Nanoarchaeota archaeon]
MKKKSKKSKSKNQLSQEWKNIIFNVAFSLVAVLIVIIFYDEILTAVILEAILGIIGLLKWKSKVTLSIFIVGGVWGALIELLIIHASGAWTYQVPSILNIIPLWLIFIWANASAYFYETGKELQKIINEK